MRSDTDDATMNHLSLVLTYTPRSLELDVFAAMFRVAAPIYYAQPGQSASDARSAILEFLIVEAAWSGQPPGAGGMLNSRPNVSSTSCASSGLLSPATMIVTRTEVIPIASMLSRA